MSEIDPYQDMDDRTFIIGMVSSFQCAHDHGEDRACPVQMIQQRANVLLAHMDQAREAPWPVLMFDGLRQGAGVLN